MAGARSGDAGQPLGRRLTHVVHERGDAGGSAILPKSMRAGAERGPFIHAGPAGTVRRRRQVGLASDLPACRMTTLCLGCPEESPPYTFV